MSTPRILVVDDDRSLCLVVEKLLANEGYDVETTTDSAEAMDRIAHNQYDLLVLDFLRMRASVLLPTRMGPSTAM
jgi:CheY-like chemotaxis protein